MLGRRCNRKEAEEKLQQSDECLSLGQREWVEREKMNACAALKQARIWASSLPRFGECVCEANGRGWERAIRDLA